MKSVYSAVRTGSLNKAVCASSLKGEKQIYDFLVFKFFQSLFYIKFFVLFVSKSYSGSNKLQKTTLWTGLDFFSFLLALE
jgi:hypothetical protein